MRTHSKHALTRPLSAATSSRVGARTIHLSVALSGITVQQSLSAPTPRQPATPRSPFGAQSFPVTIPCTRCVGLICWRSTAMLAYAKNAASSAFRPSHG